MVTYPIDTANNDPESAKSNIDADYVRGIVLSRAAAPKLVGDDPDSLIEVKGPRPIASRMIQRDSDTEAYVALDAGRSMIEFKDFLWDDLMVEASMEGKTSTSKW